MISDHRVPEEIEKKAGNKIDYIYMQEEGSYLLYVKGCSREKNRMVNGYNGRGMDN